MTAAITLQEMGPAFSVNTAIQGGLAPCILRRKILLSPFWGVRSLAGATDLQRVAGLMDALPDHAFLCSESAAAVAGLPLPRALKEIALVRPTIGVPRYHPRIRRSGVRGRILTIDAGDLVERQGLKTTSARRTWADLSEVLPLSHLVALTDHILRHETSLCSRQSLQEICSTLPRKPGASKRARALQLADPKAESPMESIVRTILIEGGLPRPECNPWIRLRSGHRVRADLLYRDARVIIEYNGDYHRDQTQWRRDESRKSQLEDLGYRVITLVASDLANASLLVARVRKILHGQTGVSEPVPVADFHDP